MGKPSRRRRCCAALLAATPGAAAASRGCPVADAAATSRDDRCPGGQLALQIWNDAQHAIEIYRVDASGVEIPLGAPARAPRGQFVLSGPPALPETAAAARAGRPRRRVRGPSGDPFAISRQPRRARGPSGDPFAISTRAGRARRRRRRARLQRDALARAARSGTPRRRVPPGRGRRSRRGRRKSGVGVGRAPRGRAGGRGALARARLLLVRDAVARENVLRGTRDFLVVVLARNHERQDGGARRGPARQSAAGARGLRGRDGQHDGGLRRRPARPSGNRTRVAPSSKRTAPVVQRCKNSQQTSSPSWVGAQVRS